MSCKYNEVIMQMYVLLILAAESDIKPFMQRTKIVLCKIFQGFALLFNKRFIFPDVKEFG